MVGVLIRVEKSERLTAICLLLASVAFHACSIDQQSLFVDEVAEINAAHGTWQATIWRADSMPPLYPIALKSWIGLFGTDAAGRWMSVGCSVLAAISAWQYSRIWFGPTIGLWVLLLMLLNPLNIFYGQWTRAYALMLLWATVSIGAFAAGCNRGRKLDWVVFLAATVLGIYTHYYFVMMTFSLFVGWLLQRQYGRWKPVLLSLAAAGLLCLPIVVFLQEDFEYQKAIRQPRPLSLSALAYTYLSLFSGFAIGPSQGELHALSLEQSVRQVALPGIVLMLASVPLLLRGLHKLRRVGWMPTWICLLVLPLSLIGVLGALSGITYNVRFVCWLTMPLSICIALGIAATESRQWHRADAGDSNKLLPSTGYRKWQLICGALTIVFMMIALCNRMQIEKYQFEDIRAAAGYLREQGSPAESVFVVSDYMVEPLRYYLNEFMPAIELPTRGVWSVVFKNEETVRQAVESLRENAAGRYWLLYSREYHGDPSSLLLSELKNHHQLIEVKQFAGVKLYSGKVTQSAQAR